MPDPGPEMSEIHEIRALLAPIDSGNVLLPGSTIAEVIDFTEPEPFQDGPGWLLGEVRWNGWQVPVVDFAQMAGIGETIGDLSNTRIVVVKTHSDSASVNLVGILITGLPKMRKVTTGNLVEDGSTMDSAAGVYSRVSVEDDSALIPDLQALASGIEEAVYTR